MNNTRLIREAVEGYYNDSSKDEYHDTDAGAIDAVRVALSSEPTEEESWYATLVLYGLRSGRVEP